MKEKFFDAVIFDLDGVITKTAVVHSAAWKGMFDRYLKQRSEKYNEDFREFTHENDYLPFVDGKPRYKGVADFLSSRNISIPWGDPADSDQAETVCGLGNLKNTVFNEIIEKDGVEVYESTLKLIGELKKNQIRLGVASSSKNCKLVLKSVGLLDYFETRVDGIVSAKLGLKGKPEPDIFTTACDNMGVKYHRAVVVEDAISGVQAGKKGRFGMVLGVARENNVRDLRVNGADIVVEDIEELGGIEGINQWFRSGLKEDQWSLSYPDYQTDREKSRETLLTLGNGFFATRGAMEETKASEFNYPGTYMAGLYNRRKSKVGNKWIENEDFVNFIHWTYTTFRINEGEWFDPNKHHFEVISRKLDLQKGVLTRKIKVFAEDGKESLVTSQRFVSMADPHIAGISYEIMPVNYSGKIEIKTAIDGNLINEGVDRYSELDQHHLEQDDQGIAGKYPYVSVKTNQSMISLVVASDIMSYSEGVPVQKLDNHKVEKGRVTSIFGFTAGSQQTLGIKKLIAVYNNRDFNCPNPLLGAISRLDDCTGFNDEIYNSNKAWEHVWQETDVIVQGDRYAQKLIRLHIFHLIVSASPYHKCLDAGIPARGLHGEAYRGHIFWDELYIFPFYASHFPDTARSVLMYRYRRLEEAKKYAAGHGFEGAMFPWQSGSDGREETQIIHLNPVSGKWGDDYSSLQRHISLAIAYNIWLYYHFTLDKQFLADYGAEMFIEICRFWVSMTKQDGNKYSISGIMGPDEFHEKYPGAKKGGLKNNAYTNIMVSWCLEMVKWLLSELSESERKFILKKTDLKKKDLERWNTIFEKLRINISKAGIIEQFEGYFKLKELNLEKYLKKYDDIHRMDRILKAEGKSPDEYKMAKQADTLMIYYNLGDQIVDDILKKMGYNYKTDRVKKNFDYYIKRTSHGSTLSRVVHAQLAGMAGYHELSYRLYMEALESDYIDIQGGTTAEGIHAGVMGGTVLLTLRLLAGLNWLGDVLSIDPGIPDQWDSIAFKFHFRNNIYSFFIKNDEIQIDYVSSGKKNSKILIRGSLKTLKNDTRNRFML